VIRVFLVDDQTLVRKGIRSLLSLLPDIEIVGEAVDGAEALRLIPSAAPDVVLLDIRMPEMDGLSVLRRLAEPGRAPHFIILTTFDDADALFEGARRAPADFCSRTFRSSSLPPRSARSQRGAWSCNLRSPKRCCATSRDAPSRGSMMNSRSP
jgi:DNA-binding NarL/FixJ family response regulator